MKKQPILIPFLLRLTPLLIAALSLWCAAIPADGEVPGFTNLYLLDPIPDGANPQSGLALGKDGYLYGTTLRGSPYGVGTLFKISTNGTYSLLYTFTNGVDGGHPCGGLVQGIDGSFYGTTQGSGINYSGSTVFSLASTGVLTPLYSFSNGVDGGAPTATLIQGRDGFLYGSTYGGGTNGLGALFKISTNGVFSPLYSFTNGIDGTSPTTPLTQGTDGNLYGSTSRGGQGNDGTLFQVTTNGGFTLLYTFTNGADGAGPSSVTQGVDGYLYGSTGRFNSSSTIFKMTTNGALTVLDSISGGLGDSRPSSLVQGTDGNFYGTTSGDGTDSLGTVFRVSPSGAFTSLFSFTNGTGPSATNSALVQGGGGNFYGITLDAGGFSAGVIFQITVPPPSAPVFQSISHSAAEAELTWSTLPEAEYQLQYNGDLNSVIWTNLGPVVNTTNASITVTNTTADPQRFYRVYIPW